MKLAFSLKYTAWNLGRVQQLTGQIGRAIQTA